MSDLTLSHLTTAKKAHRTPLKTLPLTIAIALASPLSAVHVNASALMEEIVVTAQKREENLQDVPISISAFSGDALKEMGAESISDLGRATAGVEMNNESVTQPSYSIRGIQTDDFTVGSDPAVALYVDGVYAARGAGAEIPLDDVERIEILKGPQGTLFGRNATGGAIHYITKKPSQETEGSISGSLGDYNKQKLDFTYNTPISDTVAIRVGGSMNRRDGFIENTNGPDLNDIDSKSFRASVLWTPSDKTEVIWRGEYSDLSQNSGTVNTVTESVYAAGENVSGPLDVFGDASMDVASLEERDLFGTSIEVNHDFENFTLTSITAYRSMNVTFINDEDGSSDPGHYFSSENLDDQDQFSQEFRFTGETEKLKWTLGAGYSKEHVDHTTYATTNTNTLENFALYAGLLDNVDALASLGLSGAALGLTADSSEADIAEVINGARAALTAGGANGIALAQFMFPLYASQPNPLDPTGASSPFGALHLIDGGAGCGGASVGDFAASYGAQNAIGACMLPQIQAGLTSSPDWTESVHNTGTYESSAVYGDFTYSLTERMNLTAGLRYTYDEKVFTVETGYNPSNSLFNTIAALGSQPLALGLFFYNNGLDGGNVPQKYEENWDALSGRVVLDYFVSDTAMVYGSVATGFKSGGFNSLSFGPDVEPAFDQEEVTNYEIGYKADLMDGKVRFNAAAYFYEYDNKQDLELVGTPIPSYNITTSDVEGQGVDLEVYWSVTDQLFVSANYSYLDTEITGYTVVNNGEDLTGEPVANTPENKFYVMGEYTIPFDSAGELVLRADYNWSDERVSIQRDKTIDSYQRINARATFNSASDAWSVAAWVNNLTDEEDLRDYTGPGRAIGSHTAAVRLPRMYGVDVAYRF
ncbi:TonB-dependent receptor [Aestuariicella hydrocarbonica]|uniref:TonB-dependent receptor n=1 Tax=Pseudomaricurvus hydrocarbonicus TaxID=1470433 RepID=A0A9E5JUT4_9GAMM|nr:TonB-dependent receptor [Aestuariicella hydrocarbonica]NHO64961.1 TonB-dependent receptor [Aestuariicella hydrocarbonica]